MQGRFQHSGETISRYIPQYVFLQSVIKASNSHYVLECIKQPHIYSALVFLPDAGTRPMPAHDLSRREQAKFLPFFPGALGALDGTHINVHCAEEDRARHRNRKNDVTQNVLAACIFDLQLRNVSSGREGSVATSLPVLSGLKCSSRSTWRSIRTYSHHLAARKSFHASQAQLPETPLTIQEAKTRSDDDVSHARQVSDEDDVPEYAKARETPDVGVCCIP